jgi:hypothetical protein
VIHKFFEKLKSFISSLGPGHELDPKEATCEEWKELPQSRVSQARNIALLC